MSNNTNSKGLLIAVAAGALSMIIGAFALANIFDYYMANHNVSGGSLGKLGLVLCEVLISTAFSVIALLLIFVNQRTPIARGNFVFLGILRLLFLFLMLAVYWKPGWYYILDPNGSYKAAYLIVVLSNVQWVAFMLNGNRKEKKGGFLRK